MPVQSTVFSRLLQHVPWAAFDRAVAVHRMDKGHRRLDARSHLAALIAGQLIDAHGLRDIEAALATHAPGLKRRRIQPACRSTLADANRTRAPEGFEALIPALLSQLSPSQARRSTQDLRLIDATMIRPGHGAQDWARYQRGQIAAKLHVVFDPNAQVPVFYELTSGLTPEIKTAKNQLPIEADATYIFDLGYYDFGFWAKLDAKGCRFVTRLKHNTPVTTTAQRQTGANSSVLADKNVRLPQRLAQSRNNPFAKEGRLVTVTTETGKTLKLFTNDLDSPAQTIAGLYKTRWQIELFFRWIKQNLKISRFHGRSKNAVRLQIAAAMITYLLLRLMHKAAKTVKTPARFAASLKNALFIRIDVPALVERIERKASRAPTSLTPQLELRL